MAKFNLNAVFANLMYRQFTNFSFEFNIKDVEAGLKKIEQNLIRSTYLVMEIYGTEIQNVIVSRFRATSKYRKPNRRTNKILNVINQHEVVQGRTPGSEYVELKVGNRSAEPFYLRFQEEGTASFEFDQKFLLVKTGPRMFKLISKKKDWFRANRRKPFLIRVHNPGIRPRGFIKAGSDYIHRTINAKLEEIIKRTFE